MKTIAKALALVAAIGVVTAMADAGCAKKEEKKEAPAQTNAPAEKAQSQTGANQ
ncbi:MAG: hypothetical protein N2652_07345 [Kiritimatiellae bacterium]|nr:hypothetical protein [Kiritimatiellia bacterium]